MKPHLDHILALVCVIIIMSIGLAVSVRIKAPTWPVSAAGIVIILVARFSRLLYDEEDLKPENDFLNGN